MSALVRQKRRRPIPTSFRLAPDTRARIEAAIERMITVLDQLDGDADLEDGHDAEVVNEDGDFLDDGEFDEAEAVRLLR